MRLLKNISILSFIILLFVCHINQLMADKLYRGAELRTKVSFQYGRFEVRMKSAALSGMLSSFFTYHDNDPDPIGNWNEIDIEILGRYNNDVQFNTITPGQVNHEYHQEVNFNPHEAFHVYAIEWTPDYVAWHVDSVEVYRQTDGHIQTLNLIQKLMMNIWPPDYPDWVGNFDDSKLPVYAYYDWVKYYSYTPGVGDNFTLQWEDHFDHWDTVRWAKASHTWDGNNCDFIYDNAVFNDGYFILCLTHPYNTGYNGGAIEDNDIDAPYMFWARFFDNFVYIYFSEMLEETSAETTSNYILPGLTVEQADLLEGGRKVRLQANEHDPEINYNLVVVNVKDIAPEANAMQPQQIIITNALTFPLHINIAGDALQSYLAGQVWDYSKEYGRTGGSVIIHDQSLDFANTDEDSIYRSECRGVHFYRIRLPNAKYNLTLMMAETEYNSTGNRIFDIYAEGQLYFDNLDIYAEAGANTACEKTITNLEVKDNIMDLYFSASAGEAVLSGIKLERLSAGIKNEYIIPSGFRFNIYPNPFNPAANIAYNLESAAEVDINLFNINGRRVKNIMKARQHTGFYEVKLNAAGLSSGIYFCSLNLDGNTRAVKKVVYIK